MKARSPVPSPKNSPAKPSRNSTDGQVNSAATEHDCWEPLALAAAAQTPADALDRALAVLGPSYRTDRAWVGRYNAALTHFWAAHEWVRSGIVSHFHEVQGASVDMMPDAHRKFLKGEIVAIPDVDRLPRQSRALQAELRREGIRSTLCAPLVHEKKLIGFFGFDYVRALAAWTPAELARLQPVGKYLAALLHRTMAPAAPSHLPATPPGAIYISERSGQRALAIGDIAFIEADGDYSRLHLAGGRCHLELRSLRTWSAQLPRERFLRVHQSYLVNSARIERLARGPHWALHLQGLPDPIPVGRAFRHELRLHMGF